MLWYCYFCVLFFELFLVLISVLFIVLSYSRVIFFVISYVISCVSFVLFISHVISVWYFLNYTKYATNVQCNVMWITQKCKIQYYLMQFYQQYLLYCFLLYYLLLCFCTHFPECCDFNVLFPVLYRRVILVRYSSVTSMCWFDMKFRHVK